jgi:hypothetical protein
MDMRNSAAPPRPEGSRRPSAEATAFENGRRDKGNRSAYSHPAAALQDAAIGRLRRQRQIAAIHRLGARAVLELVEELDRYYGLGESLDNRLERYAGLDLEVLRAVGGDRFPPRPLRGLP